MEPTIEALEPQNPPGVAEPKPSEITISQIELDELKHKAGVSSQNFERLKKAEAEKADLQAQLDTYIVPSDPEDQRIDKLASELSDVKAKLSKSEVLEAHPRLKEMWSELEQFRNEPDNLGMNLKTAAKAFLIEKGLLEPMRKGLEKPTGGSPAPVSSGMSAEDVSNLRQTNYKKYREMIKKGQIQIQ